MYPSVDEVDLFLGGLVERPEGRSLLGPTFQCLVGDQFKRLKLGDRFWYEEAGQPNSFTQGKKRKEKRGKVLFLIMPALASSESLALGGKQPAIYLHAPKKWRRPCSKKGNLLLRDRH